MTYSVYKLKFSTGLHIGRSMGGPSLDDGEMTIRSDTLFSALCCEGAKNGLLEQLVRYFRDGTLAISDSFPYCGQELFLPKPIIFTGNRKREGDPGLKKILKKINYIPLSLFENYLKGIKGASIDWENFKFEFGNMAVNTRVALRGQELPQPYHVATWNFAPDCGLYIILHYSDEKALKHFTDTLLRLGFSGIGGKQSAGLGKFSVEEIPIPSELNRLLQDTTASYQMLLGTALPPGEELDSVLTEGWYTTLRRGGFVRSENYAKGQLKKRTIYMLSAGSCLKKRFVGNMFNLAEGGQHPVWRCGSTLFAGVSL